MGKAILATQTRREIEIVWEKTNIQALTPNTILDFEQFYHQMKQVRLQGYAVDNEENELGIRCVAFSLPAINGMAQSAFSISGLAHQMTDEHIDSLVSRAFATKQGIIRDLGWH